MVYDQDEDNDPLTDGDILWAILIGIGLGLALGYFLFVSGVIT
jgi:hypothetical protein